jgi:hypothetical protein
MFIYLEYIFQSLIFPRNLTKFLKGKLLFTILIFSLNSFAQNAKIESIKNNFTDYQQNNLQEKIFIHTDKNIYLTGEIIWFKVYLVDGFFHKPLNLSKIVYVELLDKNNKPTLQAKIEMNDGFGNGSFQLPISINSGQYSLKAYTSWMKNYNTDFFFQKTITIINPTKALSTEIIVQNKDYDINFFPEGGSLVNEIESKVGFRVVDKFGKGQMAKGVVFNEKNDTLALFNSDKFGFGNFKFRPKSNEIYKATITFQNGKTIEKVLPKAFEKGFVMQIISDLANQLKVSVKHSDDISENSTVYLMAHTKGVFKLILTENLRNNEAIFTIDKNKLGDGISQITLFTNNNEAVCERLYFKIPEKQLQIGLKLDEIIYETRKKVTVNITSNDKNSKPKMANLSMAVYQIDSLQNIDQTTINNYFNLSTDLKGKIEAPEYYFANNAGLESETDNLMLTLVWDRFQWKNVIENKKTDFKLLPEYTGHILSGKLTNSKTGAAVANINSFLTIPGTETKFYTANSDNDGNVRFDLKNFYNEGEIIWQTNSAIDSIYSFKISNPFVNHISGNGVSDFSLQKYNLVAMTNHYKYSQIQSNYSGRKNRKFMPTNSDTTAFYGKPDYSYLLDNYVRFTSMEEVIREYVLPVNVRKSGGKNQLHVLDKLKQDFFETEPLILLDGLPVFDTEKLLKYDPLKIKKLEVISGKYFLRNMAFDGIVNFITYTGQLTGFELDPKAVLIDYEGIQLKREFYSPKYETESQSSSRLPDFRQTMHWNPQIKTNKNGLAKVEFYTSDFPGKYAIVLQGITNDGETGVKIEYFEVKKK